jgi:hypothetical protein
MRRVTLDDLIDGKLARRGLRVVSFDPDPEGVPWRPTLYVESIEDESPQSKRHGKKDTVARLPTGRC